MNQARPVIRLVLHRSVPWRELDRDGNYWFEGKPFAQFEVLLQTEGMVNMIPKHTENVCLTVSGISEITIGSML